MIENKIKALAETKAKVERLEKSIAAELHKELAALPGKFGFSSLPAFFSAVRAATKGKVQKPAKSGKSTGRKKRAVITAETKAKVKALVEAGKTGDDIAKAAGISLPSVQNIKKALGLVKPRK